VTLNLVPDDDVTNNVKGKTAMKWDSAKKRYILKKVDRDGRVIKEKRNESGAKITKLNAEKTKDQEVYKKWMKKTHLKLQPAGEVENSKAIELAKTSTQSRKMLKSFGKRHKDINKGEDVRSNSKMLEMK
jgi:hypothetical protein